MIVFDLDHTLLSANSSFHFGLFLYRQKFFSTLTLLASLIDYTRHKWFSMPLPILHHRSFSRIFQGRLHVEIQSLVEQFLKEKFKGLIFIPVFNRLQEAKKEGKTILILSSSPDFLVKPIANRFKADFWQATSYKVCSRGTFCSVEDVMTGIEKTDYVKQLAAELSIPLSSITVYSDSWLDLPLLKIAGQAIGVSPDRRLKRHCLQEGWEIL